MGVGGISIWQLLIILLIVILLFGTKRLKNIGSDLGEAIRGFRRSLSGSDKDDAVDAPEGATLAQSHESRPAESSTRPAPTDPAANRERT
ncbi:MAG: twin-arginine translocase TatA/TatE family subunit [Thermochromatium sp.]